MTPDPFFFAGMHPQLALSFQLARDTIALISRKFSGGRQAPFVTSAIRQLQQRHAKSPFPPLFGATPCSGPGKHNTTTKTRRSARCAFNMTPDLFPLCSSLFFADPGHLFLLQTQAMNNRHSFPDAANFAFVSNHLKVEKNFSFELIPGYVFRHANRSEISLVVKQLELLSAGLIERRSYYEYWFDLKNPSQSPEKLLPDEWRYFIIEVQRTMSECSSLELDPLEFASTICRVPLELDIRFLPSFGVPSMARLSSASFNRTAPPWFNRQLSVFGMEEAQQIKDAYEKVQTVATKNASIKHSIDLLYDLRRIPENHALLCLGLFAVIESLIAHNPRGNCDSLGHQIKTKIPLLSKKFPRDIDYSCFGKTPTSPETIWSNLYEVRSRVAHGGDLKFDKKIKMLKDLRTCACFLNSVAKSLLLFALDEPQLINDLQKC
ncbi:MAG: hypothetical protein ACYC26_14465 [Phycisphaerales bacterium]